MSVSDSLNLLPALLSQTHRIKPWPRDRGRSALGPWWHCEDAFCGSETIYLESHKINGEPFAVDKLSKHNKKRVHSILKRHIRGEKCPIFDIFTRSPCIKSAYTGTHDYLNPTNGVCHIIKKSLAVALKHWGVNHWASEHHHQALGNTLQKVISNCRSEHSLCCTISYPTLFSQISRSASQSDTD